MTLEQRIDRLERSAARWRLAAFALAILILAGAVRPHKDRKSKLVPWIATAYSSTARLSPSRCASLLMAEERILIYLPMIKVPN